MLFDLKGRRRHVVQATYLMLAVLMGGGLILFGIGGGTSGGLLDAFKGGGGSSNGNSVLAKEVAAAQVRLAANPQDQAALTDDGEGQLPDGGGHGRYHHGHVRREGEGQARAGGHRLDALPRAQSRQAQRRARELHDPGVQPARPEQARQGRSRRPRSSPPRARAPTPTSRWCTTPRSRTTRARPSWRPTRRWRLLRNLSVVAFSRSSSRPRRQALTSTTQSTSGG